MWSVCMYVSALPHPTKKSQQDPPVTLPPSSIPLPSLSPLPSTPLSTALHHPPQFHSRVARGTDEVEAGMYPAVVVLHQVPLNL